MSELIEMIKYKGHKINIYPDENSENPMEWGTLGHFYHWKDNGREELLKYCDALGYDMETRELVNAPDPDAVKIDKYEHSGIAYSVAGEGFECRWDTSHAWAVWVPDEEIKAQLKGLKGAKRRQACIGYARQACTTFNTWASGGIVGYSITKEETCAACKHTAEDVIDSCWGYYTSEQAIDDARGMIDSIHSKKGAPAHV